MYSKSVILVEKVVLIVAAIMGIAAYIGALVFASEWYESVRYSIEPSYSDLPLLFTGCLLFGGVCFKVGATIEDRHAERE